VLNSLSERLWLTGQSFSVPLREQFRGLTTRSGVLFRGPAGWGEFSPFSDYSTERDALWLNAAIESAYLNTEVPEGASVAVNAIIGETEDVLTAVRTSINHFGCSTIKIKVGGDLETDLEKLHVIHSELESHFPDKGFVIRIDANARWSLDQAIIAMREMSHLPIEYVEQPVEDLYSTAQLRRSTDIPIALDESIRVDGVTSIKEFADIAIIKVSPLGGLTRARQLVEVLDVPVRVSGALETSVGLFPSLMVAWQCAPSFAAGLGTGMLFASDVVSQTVVPQSGRIAVSRSTPEPECLLANAATSELDGHWKVRTAAALKQLPKETIALLTANL
jgi:o-succinylbenzoate synthase